MLSATLDVTQRNFHSFTATGAHNAMHWHINFRHSQASENWVIRWFSKFSPSDFNRLPNAEELGWARAELYQIWGDIGQSSAFTKFVLALTKAAQRQVGSKTEAKFILFAPVKHMEVVSKKTGNNLTGKQPLRTLVSGEKSKKFSSKN